MQKQKPVCSFLYGANDQLLKQFHTAALCKKI